MGRRSLFVAGVAILAAFCVAVVAQDYTWSPLRWWEGRPSFTEGTEVGYFVWNDEGGWHLRWTSSRGERHRFSGIVRCNGAFVNFMPMSMGPGDWAKQSSRGLLQFDAQALRYDKDGMDFRMDQSATYIVLDLRIDGRAAPTRMVRIGRNSIRPQDMPVRINRDPQGPGFWGR
jgi:hypothetical protein